MDIIALLLALMLVAPAAGASPTIQPAISLEGTIAAVHPSRSTFILRTISPGPTKRARPGEYLVLVGPGTELVLADGGEGDARFRRPAFADLRVGDRVALAASRLDDGRLLALRLRLISRPRGRTVTGVVTAKTRNVIVITSSGAGEPRAILILPTTVFRGLRTSIEAIRPGDFVTVWGLVNSDGSVAARAVETTPAGGTGRR